MSAGPEEARDWPDALDRVANSMATHERQQQTVAQAMAAYREQLAVLEIQFGEAVVYGETPRSDLSEACGNTLKTLREDQVRTNVMRLIARTCHP